MQLVGQLLMQFNTESIFRIKISPSGGVQNVEKINLGHRVRDITSIGDKIYAVTDDGLFIEISKMSNHQLLPTGFPELTKCTICHKLESDSVMAHGPSLAKIYNSQMGSQNYRYSSALKKSTKFIWTKEALKVFLNNPNSLIPGTKMPKINMTENEINVVVSSLARLQRQN